MVKFIIIVVFVLTEMSFAGSIADSGILAVSVRTKTLVAAFLLAIFGPAIWAAISGGKK